MAEFAMRCLTCRLRWLVLGRTPDSRCPFCDSSRVKARG